MQDNLPERLESILSFLEGLEDYQSKMDYLIELGENFKEVSEDIAKRPFLEENKVPACESDAYAFVTTRENNTLELHFAVENPHGLSAKALANILKQSLDGEDAEKISLIPEEIVYRIFGKDLSMGKGLGLMGMIRLVKYLSQMSKTSNLQVQ